MIASEIEFLRGGTHMAAIFQISEQSIGNVVVLLRIRAVLDGLLQEL